MWRQSWVQRPRCARASPARDRSVTLRELPLGIVLSVHPCVLLSAFTPWVLFSAWSGCSLLYAQRTQRKPRGEIREVATHARA